MYLVSLSFTRTYSAYDFTLKIRLNRENIKIHPSFCNCKFLGYQKLHFVTKSKFCGTYIAWTSWDQSSKTKDKKSRRKVGRFWLCLPSLREIWVQTSWTQKDLNWFSSPREDVLCLQMKTTQGHQTWYSGSQLSDPSRSRPLNIFLCNCCEILLCGFLLLLRRRSGNCSLQLNNRSNYPYSEEKNMNNILSSIFSNQSNYPYFEGKIWTISFHLF